MTYRAFCWADGLIEFGSKIPEGALPIAAHRNERRLREVVSANARHAYDGKSLLVPGVPEAASSDAAVDAVLAFNRRILAALARREAA